jgi:hypothetical protein
MGARGERGLADLLLLVERPRPQRAGEAGGDLVQQRGQPDRVFVARGDDVRLEVGEQPLVDEADGAPERLGRGEVGRDQVGADRGGRSRVERVVVDDRAEPDGQIAQPRVDLGAGQPHVAGAGQGRRPRLGEGGHAGRAILGVVAARPVGQ